MPGAVTLFNTVVANGFPTNCGGSSILSLGHHLGSDSTCALTATGELSAMAALLGPLQNNGGQPRTLMRSPVGPAVNNGANTRCPADDQRHDARPQHGTWQQRAVGTPYTVLKVFLPVIVR